MISGIKQFNPRAAKLANDPVTPPEQTARQRFIGFFTKEVIQNTQPMTSVRMSTRESSIRDLERTGQTTTNIKSTELKQALRAALGPTLGRPQRSAPAGLQYSQRVGPWAVVTTLDLSGHHQLAYNHLLSARDRVDFCPTYLQPDISPMSWCGIHRNTRFDLIQAGEIDEVAETIRNFCAHVLAALPALVSDLQHDLPEEIEDAGRLPLEGK